jgi:hypothetical protein
LAAAGCWPVTWTSDLSQAITWMLPAPLSMLTVPSAASGRLMLIGTGCASVGAGAARAHGSTSTSAHAASAIRTLRVIRRS